MVVQSSWSARHPVKVKIAGSSPVTTAPQRLPGTSARARIPRGTDLRLNRLRYLGV
jgi:hypothetical protein